MAISTLDGEEIDLFPALIDSMAGSDATYIRDLIASQKGRSPDPRIAVAATAARTAED